MEMPGWYVLLGILSVFHHLIKKIQHLTVKLTEIIVPVDEVMNVKRTKYFPSVACIHFHLVSSVLDIFTNYTGKLSMFHLF